VSGWNTNNGNNGTDDYGFSALPGGVYANSSFGSVGSNGYWWSTGEWSSSYYYAYYRYMGHNYSYVGSNNNSKSVLNSVRCVRD